MPFGLAEGFHWKAMFVGCSAIVLALLTLQRPTGHAIGARYFSWLSRGAARMGINPGDAYREAVKFDLLRILFSMLVFGRYVPQLKYALAAGGAEQILVAVLGLVLSGCLIVGLAVPLAAFSLAVLISPVIDTYLANPGIGSLVISMMALALALLPAGTTLSVDAQALRHPRGGAIRALYAAWGAPSLERARVARLLPLLAYAAISFCSALQHIHEPEWQTGQMVGLLLMLPQMNPGSHAAFAWAAEHVPRLYEGLSTVATMGMLGWQILMIPLLLANRYTRCLCIAWGIPFFVASEHILNIKMLGVFEYFLWGLIFINVRGRVDEPAVTVFFDDHCNLCDGTVRTLSFLDVFRIVEFAPLSKNIERMRTFDVTEEAAQTDLVGVFRDKSTRSGYSLYLALAARISPLWPMWPILKLGELCHVGPAMYRFVADRRRRLWGVCERPKYRRRSTSLPLLVEGYGKQVAPAIAIGFTVLLACFAVLIPSATGWTKAGPVARVIATVVGPAPLVFGMSRIDVFNKYDIEIYKHRVLMQVRETDGTLHPAKLMPNNETYESAMLRIHRTISRQPIYCGNQLMVEALHLLPIGHPYRTKTLHADFYSVALPRDGGSQGETNERLRLVCSVDAHYDAEGNAVASTVLSDLGTKLIRTAFFDAERATGPWLDSVQSFPCNAEGNRMANWLRLNAAALPERESTALKGFVRWNSNFEPMECLRYYAKVVKDVPTYLAATSYFNSSETCRLDATIAGAMASTALIEDQRRYALLALEAWKNRDFEACAIHSAQVRRTYFQRVIGDSLPGAFH